MPRLFDNTETLDALAEELGYVNEVVAPEPHHIKYKAGWRPKLNPIQKQAVESKAIYKIYYGERGTGKSYGGLHELVDFLYRNDNELAYIIVKEIGMGTEGGAWDKLRLEVLPEWENGLGIEFKEGIEFRTKSPYIWISNRHGGWSQVMLKSLPVANQVEGKIRGREPGLIFVDEAQTLESDTYFTSLLMQMGRRKNKSEPSKLIFACNPEGPSHWLYRRFFQMPVDEDTGEWDERYAHFHIPYSDNKDNLPKNYYEDYVLPAVKNDPIAKARLVDGEWVDRVQGNALFAGTFVEGVHVKGDATRDDGLLPVVPVPIIISWDPGSAHTCVHFEQLVPTQEKTFMLVIDEFDWVGQYMSYKDAVRKVIDRQIWWEKKMNYEFRWYHAADSSAFHQYRAAEGSFDCEDIEKKSKEYVLEKGLSPRFVIRMNECPKPEQSIEARVRMVQDALITSSFLLSASCRRTKEMFMRLESDPENSLKPKKKARYGHDFDSMTYGWFWALHRTMPLAGSNATVKPEYWKV